MCRQPTDFNRACHKRKLLWLTESVRDSFGTDTLNLVVASFYSQPTFMSRPITGSQENAKPSLSAIVILVENNICFPFGYQINYTLDIGGDMSSLASLPSLR